MHLEVAQAHSVKSLVRTLKSTPATASGRDMSSGTTTAPTLWTSPGISVSVCVCVCEGSKEEGWRKVGRKEKGKSGRE